MALTRTFAAGRDQCFQQIEKLTNSHSLRSSESLCKLLRYLAEHSLDHPGVALKEYQIATEVLGRPGSFDPQNDSTVRVQAGRLRMKLAEYYAHEGPDDPIVVELPKGSYALTFHVQPPLVPTPISQLRVQTGGSRPERSPVIAVWVLSILLVLALAACVALWRGRSRAPAQVTIPPVYRTFWARFVRSPQTTWVIFSNGSFVGRPETGMRYFNPSSDSRSFILDHYTGVGEVLAVHQLDHVFGLFDYQLGVKRGALFSLDDAKNNDLIFLGSPSENLTLLDIPGTRDFVFQRLKEGPRKGDLAVFNLHPEGNEPAIFLPTPANQPTTDDYALVALLPGLDPTRSILILAGNSTFGTQAAAEYVCREDSLSQLMQRLGVSKAEDLKPFEALIHVTIKHGVPVTTDIIALRNHPN